MKRKAFLLLFITISLVHLPAQDEDVWARSLDKISHLITLVEQNYFEPVSPETLAYSSVRGMLQTLDPHSYFLDPDNLSRMMDEQRGKYEGLGIQIQKQGDRLVVISPFEGTPAYRLGIQPGDVISHINGESTKPITSLEAAQKLRGPKGTKVNITIVREGLDEPFELTVVRDEIPLKSVPYAFMLSGDIGYMFIRNFSETTTEEFEEGMKSLAAQGMTKLILDLRGNSGGPLFQSISISDEFLPKGAMVVSIKGRNPYYNKEFRAVFDNQYEKIPLVVLINQGSASASEIVSGAVMDNDRGLIVGEDSWGKGLVQTVFTLGTNTALALTTAEYFTPSGRSIQRDYTSIDDYIYNNTEIPEKNREVKFTAKGRKVMGQGGITPDFEVKTSLQPITGELILRRTFLFYSSKFVSHLTPLSKKYIFPEDTRDASAVERDKIVINKSFEVDSSIVEDFKEYLKASNIEFSPERFKEAEAEIRRELRREIHSAIWGGEDGFKAYQQSDPAVLKALEILPMAAKFVQESNVPHQP